MVKVPKNSGTEEKVFEISEIERRVPLYIITATYPRLLQLAELTRLGQTLLVTIKVQFFIFGNVGKLSMLGDLSYSSSLMLNAHATLFEVSLTVVDF